MCTNLMETKNTVTRQEKSEDAPPSMSPDSPAFMEIAYGEARRAAWKLAREYELQTADREDLEQDMLLEVLERKHTFEPEKASPQTFLRMVMYGRGRKFLRTRQRESAPVDAATSLYDLTPDGNGKTVAMHETFDRARVLSALGRGQPDWPARADMSMDAEKIFSSLSGQQREICHLLVQMSERSIAKRLGFSRERVTEELGRIRNAFRQGGLGNYF